MALCNSQQGPEAFAAEGKCTKTVIHKTLTGLHDLRKKKSIHLAVIRFKLSISSDAEISGPEAAQSGKSDKHKSNAHVGA